MHGVALSPLQFSPNLMSPSTNAGKRRGGSRAGSSVHSLVLCVKALLQVSHADPCSPVPAKSFCVISLSQGGNGLAPHHLSGTLKGLCGNRSFQGSN